MSAHPDAKLIELGRQFEQAKAEARPLHKEWKKSWNALEAAKKESGLDVYSLFNPEIKKAWKALSRKIGHEPIRKAFVAKHGEAIKLMKTIHRHKATTLEGFAVKLAAIVFDLSDFEVSDPVPVDVAERELYRLARDMAKAVRS